MEEGNCLIQLLLLDRNYGQGVEAVLNIVQESQFQSRGEFVVGQECPLYDLESSNAVFLAYMTPLSVQNYRLCHPLVDAFLQKVPMLHDAVELIWVPRGTGFLHEGLEFSVEPNVKLAL